MSEKYQTREERKKKQQTGNNPNVKKKKSKKGTINKIFLILVALGIIGILTGVAAFAYMVKDAPKLEESALKDPIPSEIYDKDGKYVTEVGTVNLTMLNMKKYQNSLKIPYWQPKMSVFISITV